MTSDPTSDLIPLTELPGALRPFADPADAAAQNRIRYQALWTRCCDGTIPGAEKIGGRWFARRGRLKDVARALELIPPAAAKRTRAPSSAPVAA